MCETSQFSLTLHIVCARRVEEEQQHQQQQLPDSQAHNETPYMARPSLVFLYELLGRPFREVKSKARPLGSNMTTSVTPFHVKARCGTLGGAAGAAGAAAGAAGAGPGGSVAAAGGAVAGNAAGNGGGSRAGGG